MPAQRVMVCTRPDFDTATLYASYWMGRTLRVLEEHGLRITDLLGDLANKEKLVEALNDYDPIAYWGLGHGNKTQFAGQNGVVVVEKGFDEHLFVERVVHLTSCLTGLRGGLLESIENEGALAAVGYSVDFIVGVITKNFPDAPANDATKSLLAPDCVIETTLARGKAVADALIVSDNESDKEIEHWRKSGHPDADLLIWAHINNRDGKVLYGLPQTRERVLAEPLHPITTLACVATLAGTGLTIIKW